MKRVATAAVLIPLVLLAVYSLPTQYLSLLIGIVAVLAAKEYLDIVSHYGVHPIRWPAYIGIAALFIYYCLVLVRGSNWNIFATAVVIVVQALLLVILAMRHDDLREGTLALALTWCVFPYVGLTLLCLAFIHITFNGSFLIILIFLAVWVGDTAAYYVGRSLGRHKLAPRISPKKTWEGAVASSVLSGLAVALWARYGINDQQAFKYTFQGVNDFQNTIQSAHRSPLLAAILGLLINIAAQFGDLFESMIKRGAGVKDSGTLLPGHGGILDRIDALLFAAPVALLLFTILDRVLAH
jgi:phosphatidate cytidylyltransferase